MDFTFILINKFCGKITIDLWFTRSVFDLLNFESFVVSRCECFHCDAMRTLIKAHMNWHKIPQVGRANPRVAD